MSPPLGTGLLPGVLPTGAAPGGATTRVQQKCAAVAVASSGLPAPSPPNIGTNRTCADLCRSDIVHLLHSRSVSQRGC